MSVLEHPVVESLGWALLHFLWQGTLIFLAVWLLLAAIRRSSAQAQNFVLCGGMVLMAMCPVATLIYVWPRPTAPTVALKPAQTKNHIAPAITDAPDPTEPTDHEIDAAETLTVERTQPVESASAFCPSVCLSSGDKFGGCDVDRLSWRHTCGRNV